MIENLPEHVMRFFPRDDDKSPTGRHITLRCNVCGFLDSDCHESALVETVNFHKEEVKPAKAGFYA